MVGARLTIAGSRAHEGAGVIVGALVLLLGLFEVGRAVLNPEPAFSFFGGPDLSDILLAARIFAGGILSLQGLSRGPGAAGWAMLA